MTQSELNVVTGAFGYAGRHIAKRLLTAGIRVRTLTGRPDRPNPFGEQVEAVPYNFDEPDKLKTGLQGASNLFNTYWIRFPHGDLTYEKAVANIKALIGAAEDSGVRRIVHISITNPSADSPFGYYEGKAEVEKAIIESKMTHAILRPNVLFGDEGILINNIAYLLRRFPLFAIPGDGDYKVQPIYVEDLAELAVTLAEREENVITDAVGPEIFTFNDLVRLIAEKVGSRAKIIHVPPSAALLAAGAIGRIVGDVILTRDEVGGLLANLLVSDQPPTGWTLLSDWLTQNANWLGTRYMSELKKHYR